MEKMLHKLKKTSKDYFQNLGTIMSEYLTTTSLGDLARQAKEVEANIKSNEEVVSSNDNGFGGHTQSTPTTENTTSSENNGMNVTSAIRGPLGEINQ